MVGTGQSAGAVTGSVLLFPIDSVDGLFSEAAETCLDGDQATLLVKMLAPQTSFESRLNQDVQLIQNSVMREDGKVDIVVLASRLAVIGHRVAIRTALGGGAGQACFRNLNYEFLLVSSSSGPDHSEVIVDPKFREQFGLSQQTSRYTHLLSFLPDIFVGQHSRLVPLVKLLAFEMEAAFSETGITVPPWRQAMSMMSKWKPSKSRDMQVVSPTCGRSPRGALSLCSSSSSSSACSDISDDDARQALFTSLRRQQSIPRRIQSGFCVNPACPTVLEDGGAFAQDGKTCLQCALRQQQTLVQKFGETENCKREHGDAVGMALAKIRTVKLGGPR